MRTPMVALLTLFVVGAYTQRLEGWDTRFDSGTRFDALIGSGINSFQWGQIRGREDVPPRYARHAWIRNIRVLDGGDPYGRVALLWSGWEGNGTDRAEFWLLGNYKPWTPIFLPAQIGQTFSHDSLFRIRMWNEQYFSWQSRAAVVSVYAANAPTPVITYGENPSWTDLSQYDLIPNRPGIQIDPAQQPQINLTVSTGSQTVARPWISGLKRVLSLDNYATENRPSPFRDEVIRESALTWRINGVPQSPSTDTRSHNWDPGDTTYDRSFPNLSAELTVPLASLPRGSVVSFDFNQHILHIPYNAQNQPLPPPQRTPIDDLRDADRLFFDLQGLTYRYTGAVSGGGSVSDEDAPPTCLPKNPDTLDIVLNLQDFGLPYNITVTFAGRRVADNIVEWQVDIYPNLCTRIEGIDVKIRRIWGKLTAQIQRQPAFYDPLCNRQFNLVLTPIGGNDGNWLNGELYALCQETSFTRVDVEVRSIAYNALSGREAVLTDPRILARFSQSQWIETILHGDVNNDGCVDDSDLLMVLLAFGSTGANPADLNGDNRVDDSDLLIVLTRFGACY